MKPRPRKATLPAPRHFLKERVTRWEGENHRERPILISDLPASDTSERTISFVPPFSSDCVALSLLPSATPENAIREWLFRREITRCAPSGRLDVKQLATVLNFGDLSTTDAFCNGVLHLRPHRFEEWSFIEEAFNAYVKSGNKGSSPFDLLALLEPGLNLPLAVNEMPSVLLEKESVYIAFDLARPLGEQFDLIRQRHSDLQDAVLHLDRDALVQQHPVPLERLERA